MQCYSHGISLNDMWQGGQGKSHTDRELREPVACELSVKKARLVLPVGRKVMGRSVKPELSNGTNLEGVEWPGISTIL